MRAPPATAEPAPARRAVRGDVGTALAGGTATPADGEPARRATDRPRLLRAQSRQQGQGRSHRPCLLDAPRLTVHADSAVFEQAGDRHGSLSLDAGRSPGLRGAVQRLSMRPRTGVHGARVPSTTRWSQPSGLGGLPYDSAGAGPACRAEDEGVPNPSGGHRCRRCTSGPCASELLDHSLLVLAPDPTNHSSSTGRMWRPFGPKLRRSVTSGGDSHDDGVKQYRRTGARGDDVATDRSRGSFPCHRGRRDVHVGPPARLATASTPAGARRAATARAHDGLDDGTPGPAALSRPPGATVGVVRERCPGAPLRGQPDDASPFTRPTRAARGSARGCSARRAGRGSLDGARGAGGGARPAGRAGTAPTGPRRCAR